MLPYCTTGLQKGILDRTWSAAYDKRRFLPPYWHQLRRGPPGVFAFQALCSAKKVWRQKGVRGVFGFCGVMIVKPAPAWRKRSHGDLKRHSFA